MHWVEFRQVRNKLLIYAFFLVAKYRDMYKISVQGRVERASEFMFMTYMEGWLCRHILVCNQLQ